MKRLKPTNCIRKQFNVTVQDGEHESAVNTLALLFKEVLQQIPKEQARVLVQAYRDGRMIVVRIFESQYGITRKTAFQCSTADDPRLDNPQGTA